MPLKLNSTGGGSVTLDVPNTGSTFTATIPAITGTMLTADTSNNVSVSGTVVMGSYFAMRNKIINGAMEIDQRNAGAEVNPAVGSSYYLDRWMAISSVSGKFKIGQNAGSVTPPAGFINYLGITSISSYSVGASEAFGIRQVVEGLNIADLAWGTANAKTITISFWVRSSLTGTFGLGLGNNGFSRAYPASYTISAANTWEYKTVTIAGDTTGTWLTTNSVGLYLTWQIGYGSSYSGTANAWNAGTAFAPTGAVSVVGTNGATFYLTGAQLEVGSVATPFERRLFTTELQLAQRYFVQWIGTSAANGFAGVSNGIVASATSGTMTLINPVTMRTTPSLSYSGTLSLYDGTTATSLTSLGTIYIASPNMCWFVANASGGSLTPGRGAFIYTQNAATNFFRADAEL